MSKDLTAVTTEELRACESALDYHANRSPIDWYSERARNGFREDLAEIRSELDRRRKDIS